MGVLGPERGATERTFLENREAIRTLGVDGRSFGLREGLKHVHRSIIDAPPIREVDGHWTDGMPRI